MVDPELSSTLTLSDGAIHLRVVTRARAFCVESSGTNKERLIRFVNTFPGSRSPGVNLEDVTLLTFNKAALDLVTLRILKCLTHEALSAVFIDPELVGVSWTAAGA